MYTEEKKYRRGRSFAFALLIIIAVCALIQVDSAYEDMMMQEGKLGLEVRRMDEAHLAVGLLGREWTINSEKFFLNLENFEVRAKGVLQGVAEKTQELLAKSGMKSLNEDGEEEEEIEEIPVDFPTQTL